MTRISLVDGYKIFSPNYSYKFLTDDQIFVEIDSKLWVSLAFLFNRDVDLYSSISGQLLEKDVDDGTFD